LVFFFLLVKGRKFQKEEKPEIGGGPPHKLKIFWGCGFGCFVGGGMPEKEKEFLLSSLTGGYELGWLIKKRPAQLTTFKEGILPPGRERPKLNLLC